MERSCRPGRHHPREKRPLDLKRPRPRQVGNTPLCYPALLLQKSRRRKGRYRPRSSKMTGQYRPRSSKTTGQYCPRSSKTTAQYHSRSSKMTAQYCPKNSKMKGQKSQESERMNRIETRSVFKRCENILARQRECDRIAQPKDGSRLGFLDRRAAFL